MYRSGILTISDKGFRGERVDESGALIRKMLTSNGSTVLTYAVVPDEKDAISIKLKEWCHGGELDVIITTGGTGLGERDITPEATLAVLDKELPGFAEIMRTQTFAITPAAILSRAVAGVRGKCLIVNLPGSKKAVRECLGVILPAIPHAVEMITGTVTEHTQQASAE
ncbi:molybdenum cofactor biosynthesis protein B [Chloroflexota bacterium]